MKIGIIGRGPFGDVYAKTLRGMGVDHWKAGGNWRDYAKPDAAIVACAPEAHYKVAKELLSAGVPVLIEKPVCMTRAEANKLLALARIMGGIAFVGHTRLYSLVWRKFKASAQQGKIESVYAVAGGKCKIDPLFDWGSHLIAMCLDLGFDPSLAHILTGHDEQKLKFIVNGEMTFADQPESPSPLEVLITEFMAAVDKGEADVSGLVLGAKVMREIERRATTVTSES